MNILHLLIGFTALMIDSSFAASIAFKDVPQDAWFSSYIQQAADLGIVSGYTDEAGVPTGYFGPADSVSVTQALKMEIGSVGINVDSYNVLVPENNSGFPRPYTDTWWYKYFLIAKQQRVSIVECGFIPYPDRPMRRWEMARLIADVYQVTPSVPADLDKYADGVLNNALPTLVQNPYSDVDVLIALNTGSTIPFPADPSQLALFEYAQDYANRTSILSLTADGVLAGDLAPDGTRRFRPLDTLNRAEAVKILSEAYKIYGSEKAAKPASFDLPNDVPLPCA